MSTFHLKIVTPDGICYDGEAEKIIVRTTEGDVGILSRHARFLAPLQIGRVRVFDEKDALREAACSGGMISVNPEVTTLVAQTFEWAEDIDVARAKRALSAAQSRLDEQKLDQDIRFAELKIKRALNRIEVGSHEK